MMNNKKSIDDYLEERLEEWAEWLRGGNFVGIGYPSQSTLELIRKGLIMAKAIRMYYTDKLSLRTNSKKLQVSHMQFKLYIIMAKQWLIGRLNTHNH